MNEFITIAAQQLGLSEAVSTQAAGGLIKNIQQHVPAADFTQLAAKVPGLTDLVAKSATATGGGGGLGGMLGSAGSLLGGKLGSLAGLAGTLQSTGLGADKIGPFAGMLVNYLKGKAGGDLVSKILAHVPDLKKLVG